MLTTKIAISPQTETLERPARSRLARECAKLDPSLEAALAEEDLSADAAIWPAY